MVLDFGFADPVGYYLKMANEYLRTILWIVRLLGSQIIRSKEDQWLFTNTPSMYEALTLISKISKQNDLAGTIRSFLVLLDLFWEFAATAIPALFRV